MKRQAHTLNSTPHEGYGEYKSYVIGFVLSIILTLAAYFTVSEHLLAGWPLLLTLSGIALTQAIVQLVFFLHLGTEPSPYWNLVTFLFMLLILLILVIGTLWIMYHLDYAMSPQ